MADATTALETDLEHLPRDTRVGEYLIEHPIGAGGFARVYRARHPVLATQVAIKVITRALALDREAIQRFVREAQAASRITHPGVVRILDYGKLPDGRPYQVMELIDGPALDQHLAQVGRMALDEALRLLDEIAAALDAAHDAGIIHRDLKPANVLLARGESRLHARLADFGIAKALETEQATPHLTRTGTTLGTPAYMSPEQALGRAVGKGSDVYTFGVVAFELITGDVPFTGETPFETMMMHVQTPAPMPSAICADLGPRFDAAIATLLAKHPDQRPASLAAAMTMLRQAPATVHAGLTAPRPAPAMRRPGSAEGDGTAAPRSRRSLARLGALAILVLGGATSYLGWSRDEPAHAPPSPPAAPVTAPWLRAAPSRAAAGSAALGAPATAAAAAQDTAPGVDGGIPASGGSSPTPPRRVGPSTHGRVPGPPRSARPEDQLETPPDYQP